MILGREYGLDAEAMQILGLGMIFHDVGKHRITKNILYKQTPLTPPELKMLQLHPQYGAEIMSKMKDFPAGAIEILRKHHETENGKGYPDGLSGKDIPLLVKIATLVDVYDNHCNKLDPATSLTPSQAISYMFGKQKDRFDSELLARFIRCLGVYPPGTIALLSNESIGIVVAVNSKNLLRPSLLLYDPDIPKNEALVVDLDDEPDLKITNSIHPGKLSQKVYDYLSPRTRVTYFAKSTTDTQ
jgi:HD-GYP domain-containing protein (c-di-GMP phosphodiesterase class II)